MTPHHADPAAHKSETWLDTAWEAIDTSMDLLQEGLTSLLQALSAKHSNIQAPCNP
jgi:hypothetical protein